MDEAGYPIGYLYLIINLFLMSHQKKTAISSPRTKQTNSSKSDPEEVLLAENPLMKLIRFCRQSPFLTGVSFAFLAAGLALRIYQLDVSSVWIDEANTVRIARMGFGNMIAALSLDSSPPLYYLLLRFWMFLFGEGPTAIRLLSVLFSGALIGYVFIVGRRFFPGNIGLIAAALMAVAPAQILHAQQCRMYTLLPLLALGAFHCLKNASNTGSRAWLVGWCICMIGALYTHNYGWFLFPACLVILILAGELSRRPLTWFLAAAVIGFTYLPWIPVFWKQLHISAQNSWYQPIWDALGAHGNFFYTLDSFFGGRKSLSFTWIKPDALMIPRWLLFTAVSTWAIFSLFRKDMNITTKKHTRDILAFLLIPLISVILISVLFSPIYRYGRSDQLVFPAFILLAAVGISAIRTPAIRLSITALLIMFSLTNYPPLTADRSMTDDANMAKKILTTAHTGDVVLSTSLTVGPLEYYARQARVNLTFITFPRDDLNHPAIQDQASWLKKPGALAMEATATLNDVCRIAGPGRRFFTILGMEDFNVPLIHLLNQRNPSHSLIWPGKHQIAVTNTPVQLLQMTCPLGESDAKSHS